MKGIDWSLLRSFLAVVETGSLSAAAARLATTQPTVGRHVRELEATLGVTLFTRGARGLDPTEAALTLVVDARAMSTAAEAFALKAQGRSQEVSGTVRIACSVMVAALMLPPIIVELRRAEPLIQIEIVASDVAQNLLRRDADIAIRMFNPTQNALVARRLGEAPIGLYATSGYLARRGPVTSIADLVRHDLIGFDRSEAIIQLLADNGLKVGRDDFAIRCDDPVVYWQLLLSGAGLGFAQTLIARHHRELQDVTLGLAVPAMPVWLAMHEEVRTNARIRRVADILSQAMIEILTKPITSHAPVSCRDSSIDDATR